MTDLNHHRYYLLIVLINCINKDIHFLSTSNLISATLRKQGTVKILFFYFIFRNEYIQFNVTT